MIAKLRFDEFAEGADFQSEGGAVELGDHGTAAKGAKVSAFGLGRAIGVLLGEAREIAPALQFLQQLLGSGLVFDQDMRAPDFSGAFGRKEATHKNGIARLRQDFLRAREVGEMNLRVFLTGLLLTVACSADPIKHPSGAYQFELPTGWVQGEPELWHDKSQHRVLNAVKVDLPGEDKLEAWAQATAADGPKNKWTSIAVSDGTLGEKKAKVLTAIDKSQNKPMFIKAIMSINKNTGASLIFVDEDGDSPEFEANVQGVVDSFHWK